MIPRLNIYFPIGKLFCSKKHDKRNLVNSNENEFYLNNARTGISVIIKSLNLSNDSKIGVMAYNCHTVMNAVFQTNYEIVFIDVNSNLKIDQKDLFNKIDCISILIVSHLFGIVNDIKKIKENKPELIIIEDCAHAWFSRLPNGELAGSLGDFAVYSTGLGKFPSISNGGIVVVNNTQFLNKLKKIVAELPASTLKDNLSLLIKGVFHSLLYKEAIYGWFTKKIKHQSRDVSNIKSLKPHKKMSWLTFKILCQERFNIESYCDLQQKNAKLIINLLEHEPGVFPIDKHIFKYSNCFMLPVWCENKDLFIRKMKDKGVEVATHFESSLIWAKEFGLIDGISYNTEIVLKHVVMIPCHYKLSERKLKQHLK